jgi:hypothetical protein
MSDELPEALEANTPSSLHRVVGEEGKRWMQFSDAELVGLVGWHEGNRVRDGASAEVQRRGMMAARESTETLRESIEVQERLVTAIDASSDSADKFASQAQALNTSIKNYTIAMFVLAAVQVLLMLMKG